MWAIYKCLALKGAIISRLNPDTDEDRLKAHEQLTPKHFQEGGESIGELTQGINKLLDHSSPGLPLKSMTQSFNPLNECPA